MNGVKNEIRMQRPAVHRIVTTEAFPVIATHPIDTYAQKVWQFIKCGKSNACLTIRGGGGIGKTALVQYVCNKNIVRIANIFVKIKLSCVGTVYKKLWPVFFFNDRYPIILMSFVIFRRNRILYRILRGTVCICRYLYDGKEEATPL